MKICARKHSIYALFVLISVLLCSCNATKFVPENEQLLYKVHINVDGTKQVPPSKLRQYLRQTQNTEVLGFWKLQMHIYNTAPADTSTKSKKRLMENAHKLGEAPVIYLSTLLHGKYTAKNITRPKYSTFVLRQIGWRKGDVFLAD